MQEPVAILGRYARARPVALVSYAVVGLGGLLALCQLVRLFGTRRILDALPLLVVLAGLIGLHMGIIVLGRMNMRPGPTILSRNSYYAYAPLLGLLVGLYFLWVRTPALGRRWTPVALLFLGVGLAAVANNSAHKVRAMNAHIEEALRPLANQVDCVQGLIDRHGREPGFALSFDPPLLDSLESCHGVTLLEALFFRHFAFDRPTHVICGSPGCLYGTTVAEYEAMRGETAYRSNPTIALKSIHFMLYRHEGRYYATRQEKGRFSLTRLDLGDAAEGDDVEELLRRIGAPVPK